MSVPPSGHNYLRDGQGRVMLLRAVSQQDQGKPPSLGASRLRPTIVPILVTLVAGAVYLLTLSPGVLGGDAGEMQFVPYILSLAHPTGYPLLTLLGKVWATVIPIGTVAWRMNLLSAVAGAAAAGLVALLVQRLTKSPLAGLGAGLALALSDVFWGQAVISDKYALNALLVACLTLSLLLWLDEPTSPHFYALAFLSGLSLTHHRSMLLFLPLVAGYALWGHRRGLVTGSALLKAAGYLALPLLLYLWLPIAAARGLPPGTWHPRTPSEWLGYLADTGYVSQVRPFSDLGAKASLYSTTLLDQFGVLGLVVGGLGLARQIVKRDRLLPFLALGFGSQALFSAGYEVPRHWVFFLPSFLLYAIWIGEGLGYVKDVAAGFCRYRFVPRLLPAAVLLGLMALIIRPYAAQNYTLYRRASEDGGTLDIWRQDLKAGYLAERFARLALQSAEDDAVIVCDWEQATPLWYLQQVEGLRPDVQIRYPVEGWPAALESGRPVYLARSIPGLNGSLRLSAVGPLARVSETPLSEPPLAATRTNLSWENGIRLEGYTIHRAEAYLGQVLPISLYFSAPQGVAMDCSFSLRLYTSAGEQVWAEDRQALALGMYPTSKWMPGEVVGEYWEVPLPRASEGDYSLGVLLYTSDPEGGWHNFSLSGSSDEVAMICTLPAAP